MKNRSIIIISAVNLIILTAQIAYSQDGQYAEKNMQQFNHGRTLIRGCSDRVGDQKEYSACTIENIYKCHSTSSGECLKAVPEALHIGADFQEFEDVPYERALPEFMMMDEDISSDFEGNPTSFCDYFKVNCSKLLAYFQNNRSGILRYIQLKSNWSDGDNRRF